ncbi:TPA: type II toxin-antitoxin system PemK/MazF family toxin [Clostridium botulinum]|nr:type II toxin-antitoxin system PemK/MazF family toxin [Clostridium botulinum]
MIKQDIYLTKEKLNVLLNIEDTDKLKFEGLYAWCARAMELSIKERLCKVKPFRGEIWVCDFGVNVGSEIDKIRPCIVISPTDYNKISNVITVIPISHSEESFQSQVEIDEKKLVFNESSLNGMGKLEQITTVSKARFRRCIAKLDQEGMKEVEKALLLQCGIDTENILKNVIDK